MDPSRVRWIIESLHPPKSHCLFFTLFFEKNMFFMRWFYTTNLQEKRFFSGNNSCTPRRCKRKMQALQMYFLLQLGNVRTDIRYVYFLICWTGHTCCQPRSLATWVIIKEVERRHTVEFLKRKFIISRLLNMLSTYNCHRNGCPRNDIDIYLIDL